MPLSVPLPLDGIRVIEICNVAAGPFCGLLLANMGADVIKVKHPDGGDTLRSWPPMSDGFSENFAALNRNKRSLTLDLKDPAAIATVGRLVADSDVLIENNRPNIQGRITTLFEEIEQGVPCIGKERAGPIAVDGGC